MTELGPVWKLDWLEEVAADADLTGFHVRVAVAIQAHVNGRTGITFVGSCTVADDIGATRQGVNKAADRLEAAGLLEVKRCGKGRGRWNEYRPVLKGNGGFPSTGKKETAGAPKGNGHPEKGNGRLQELVKGPVKEPVAPAGGAGDASAAPPPPLVAEAFKAALAENGEAAWADLFDLDREDGALVATARTDAAFDAIAGKAGKIGSSFAARFGRAVPLRLVGPRGRVDEAHTADSGGAAGDDEDFLRRTPKPEAADAA